MVYDVIIIGSNYAGLAAICKRAELNVIVIERQANGGRL